MITIAEIIGRVNTQLKDTAWLRWPLAELCADYNDAVRAVILARPDAGATTEILTSVIGTRQQLPEGAIRLIEMVKLQDGRALRPVPRDVLDCQYPDWHQMTGPVECYIYNESVPKTYYLFPGPDRAQHIEAVVARIPPPVMITHLKDRTPVPIDELYVNPLVDWILFRAFSKDGDAGANLNLAMQHYQAFSEQLGVKQNAENVAQQRKQSQYQGGGL
ncbi:hypothetical protein AXW37_06420 [Yersinia ruckeri]|uniref:phage adaptor protein n=1 Tax=Yersinia ruckeri TaxID=29486 RepID=UPI0004E3A2B9|nr:DUF6682 family protein [Yersinia ruckeri]ARZ00537.1 hypothetical protein QMA0440_01193 [Yersinia ruckeri]EKN4689018.1 hypothetical protein [Yersinia ruckeri]KFE37494.1 hypothetical protein nADLYRO1b_3154 [Yersinia ruckeri]MCK8585259.1 hypothetical protein [Yersinia ruckeri]MCW6524291.1 hypothetical protein [Yersinia ruckeri]